MDNISIHAQVKCVSDTCAKTDFDAALDLLGVGVRQYADKDLIEKEQCNVNVTVDKEGLILVSECPLKKKK